MASRGRVSAGRSFSKIGSVLRAQSAAYPVISRRSRSLSSIVVIPVGTVALCRRSEERLDLVDLSTRNVEGGVVSPHGLLVRALQQAIHLSFGVVVELQLTDPVLVGRARFGLGSQLLDVVRRELETVVEVHELRHVSPLTSMCEGRSTVLAATCRVHPDESGGAISGEWRSLVRHVVCVVSQPQRRAVRATGAL